MKLSFSQALPGATVLLAASRPCPEAGRLGDPRGAMRRGRRIAAAAVVAALAIAQAAWAQQYAPPRFKAGDVPLPPLHAVGWGEVILELAVGPGGRVEAVKALRTTSAFDEPTRRAASGWVFDPARFGRDPIPVAGGVLVVAVFRPPTLTNAPMPGERPREIAPPSEAVPFPTTMVPPVYPVNALGDGVVLVEVRVGPDGAPEEATVVRSAGVAFDQAALAAATAWRFRPARVGGATVPTFAYLVFAFRAPVVLKPPR